MCTHTAARERNVTKASLLYDTISGSNGFYFSPVEESVRSKMNVPFTIPSNPDLEKAFIAGACLCLCVGVGVGEMVVVVVAATAAATSFWTRRSLVELLAGVSMPLDLCMCCVGRQGIALVLTRDMLP